VPSSVLAYTGPNLHPVEISIAQGVIEAGDDRGRRAGRHEHAEPRLDDQFFDAGFLKGTSSRPRNGFVYTMERANGAMVGAKPYVGQRQLDQGHMRLFGARRSDLG
jgi:hypothetical protein